MLLSNNNIINKLSRFLIVLLFVYAGCSKVLAHTLFVNQLSQIIFLKNIAVVVSIALPILEILTGFLIAGNQTQIYGWWLAYILMTIFTVYVAMMLLSKNSLPCTCGGVIASMTWKQHLIFNIFFMFLLWFMLLNYSEEKNKIISTNKRK